MRHRVLVPTFLSLLLACGGAPTSDPAGAARPDGRAGAKLDAKPDAKSGAKPDAPVPGDAAPFATPTAKPPPPPAGAAVLDPPLYVQRCDAAHPCPSLLQPAGETHCRDLTLGALEHWRLPDRAEVARFARASDLDHLEGFHWTRTAFSEDAKQAWIVDPKSGQETTIPRDRKPFTIRCVFDP